VGKKWLTVGGGFEEVNGEDVQEVSLSHREVIE
jgi:hypothetical protein